MGKKLVITFLGVLAVFGYFNILPRYFSFQDPIAAPEFTQVLGDSTTGKKIEVDLTNQKLYMIENNNRIREFLVSTGKWGKTPTGTFAIWTKLRYVRMRGGNKALGTYYDLPNVPYTMFFGGGNVPNWKGFGIHGTYWHNNFGHPMSHGCINMRTNEAAEIFNWAEVGTPVVIYGVAPRS